MIKTKEKGFLLLKGCQQFEKILIVAVVVVEWEVQVVKVMTQVIVKQLQHLHGVKGYTKDTTAIVQVDEEEYRGKPDWIDW